MSSAAAGQRTKREQLCVLAGALLLALGCASRSPPPVRTAQKAPPPARLTWLPAESTAGRGLAKAVNDQLGQVSLPGAGASVKSAVSMEVAQLAIECTEPTPSCYAAVGRSLGADEMLWAELGGGGGSSRAIRVALLLYDVRAGVAPRRVERTFDNVDAARSGVAALAEKLKTGRGSP
jgi:hypothetical protein